MKNIEFVCSGNNGRSPVAELIATNYLERVGADREYSATSSGTIVDLIKDGGFPIKVMTPIIDIAKEREIYSQESLQDIERALRENDSSTVERYFREASDVFMREEAQERGELLKELGMRGEVKIGRDQTIARSNTIAILPVDRKNYHAVLKIYGESGYNPVISIMSVLATGNPLAEVENAFGLGKNFYRSRIEQLSKEVPEAVKRIIVA